MQWKLSPTHTHYILFSFNLGVFPSLQFTSLVSGLLSAPPHITPLYLPYPPSAVPPSPSHSHPLRAVTYPALSISLSSSSLASRRASCFV